MPTLFISYKRDDKVAVTTIANRLEREFHYDVWIDVDSIPGGEDWRNAIRQGIEKADVVLLMLTPDACASRFVKEEIDYALELGRKIVPLQIKAVTEAQLSALGVAHLNYVDFLGDERTAWEKLLSALPTVLPRDKRMLDPNFRARHTEYLRTLFARYGTVNLTYLLDAAPREAVSLFDVYVPLKLGVSFNLEVVNGELVDWWLRDLDAPETEERPETERAKPKVLDGFQPQGEPIQAWEEQLREAWEAYKAGHEARQQERDEKDRQPLEDGTYYWRRIESETAPALMPQLVITGDPGSGKTTLLRHLALCMAGDMLREGEEAQADLNRLGFWPLPAYTPIFVELRDLMRKAFPNPADEVTVRGFLDYVRDEQLAPHRLEDYAEHLREQLSDGSAMIFMDGLDEIPNADTPERREQVKALVRLLHGQFPQCRIVITSRPYAYNGDWRLEGFGHVKLAPLTPTAWKNWRCASSAWCWARNRRKRRPSSS